MSVVEYNIVQKKSTTTHRIDDDGSYTNTEEQTYNRNVPKGICDKDLCILARQLSTLLRAGLPLVPALSAIVEQLQEVPQSIFVRLGISQNTQIEDIMQQVTDNVNGGSTLADAIRIHPGVFSDLFVNMVAAGEISGTLQEVLQRLAEMIEKRVHLTGKVKSAIAYPIMMTVVAVGVVVFLLSYVVPSITQIFLEMNKALPWPTRVLISTSNFMQTYFIIMTIIGCVVFFGTGAWLRTKDGRLTVDRWKIKLPLFGSLLFKLEIARLTRTLSILLISGIPILSALETAKGVIKNRFIASALDPVKRWISKGDTIANAIRKTGLFQPIVFHIIATGQMSGDIETGLVNIADMYESEVELTIKALTSLLEPAILLVMGIVVGFIVLAILLPIFEINQVL